MNTIFKSKNFLKLLCCVVISFIGAFSETLYSAKSSPEYHYFITHKHITRLYKRHCRAQDVLASLVPTKTVGLVEELRLLQKQLKAIVQKSQANNNQSSTTSTSSAVVAQESKKRVTKKQLLELISIDQKDHWANVISNIKKAFQPLFDRCNQSLGAQSNQQKNNKFTDRITSSFLECPDYCSLPEILGFPSIQDITLTELDFVLSNEEVALENTDIFEKSALIREKKDSSLSHNYFQKTELLQAVLDGLLSFFTPQGFITLLQQRDTQCAFYFVLSYKPVDGTITVTRRFFGSYKAIESDDEKEMEIDSDLSSSDNDSKAKTQSSYSLSALWSAIPSLNNKKDSSQVSNNQTAPKNIDSPATETNQTNQTTSNTQPTHVTQPSIVTSTDPANSSSASSDSENNTQSNQIVDPSSNSPTNPVASVNSSSASTSSSGENSATNNSSNSLSGSQSSSPQALSSISSTSPSSVSLPSPSPQQNPPSSSSPSGLSPVATSSNQADSSTVSNNAQLNLSGDKSAHNNNSSVSNADSATSLSASSSPINNAQSTEKVD